jgi:hypothetical protein
LPATSIDLTDFTFLAGNFNSSIPAADASTQSLGALVPEPTSFATLTLTVCGSAITRRRRRPPTT